MKKILQINQCVALLSAISARGTKNARILDQTLVVSVLLSGSHARLWTWGDLETTLRDAPYAVFDAIRTHALSRRISIAPFNYISVRYFNWEDRLIADYPIFSVDTTPLTTQEITRRLKRYFRIMGVPTEYASLRTLSNSHKFFLRSYGNAEAVAYALGLPTIWDRPSRDQFSQPSIRDPRLHGIGRRSGA